MNGMQPGRVYAILLAFFMLALGSGVVFFLSGMQSSSYVVTDGFQSSLRYIDQTRYDQYLVALAIILEHRSE